MRLIDIDDLRVGMIVGSNIKTIKGTLIIPKGRVLTSVDIEKICNKIDKDIEKVWVYDLLELKPLILEETLINKQYLDFIVDGFKSIFHNSIGNEFLTEDLIGKIRSYFNTNKDLLYEELVLRDNHCYTYEHSINVALYSLMIGLKLNLSSEDLISLLVGSILHDVGKIDISNSVLDKPARLDDSEFKAIQQHPIYGVQRASNLKFLSKDVLDIICQHHEKLNGTGYPYGLKGDEINKLARIVAVADIFDAVTSKRSYHIARPIERGISILMEDVERGEIDGTMVDALVGQLILYPLNSMVLLSNGVSGLVIETSANSRPIVQGFENNEIYNLDTDSSLSILRCL